MAFASNSWRQSCAFTPQHQRKFQAEFLPGPRQNVPSEVLTFFTQYCHTSTVTLTCVAARRTHTITNDWYPGWFIMCCKHGFIQGQLGDLVSPTEWWASSWWWWGSGQHAGWWAAYVSKCPRHGLPIIVVSWGCPMRMVITHYWGILDSGHHRFDGER